MSYTQLALLAVPIAILFDLFITKRKMIFRRSFLDLLCNYFAVSAPYKLVVNFSGDRDVSTSIHHG